MEEWRVVPRFPSYQVSNFGSVRGNKGLLKLWKDKRGYVVASLSIEGKTKNVSVHTLVAEAFIGPRPVGHDVHHKDTAKQNNWWRNLEYLPSTDHQELPSHRFDFKKYNQEQGITKLNEEKVRQIFNLYSSGTRKNKIAKMFDVTPTAIGLIIKGKNWKSVSLAFRDSL